MTKHTETLYTYSLFSPLSSHRGATYSAYHARDEDSLFLDAVSTEGDRIKRGGDRISLRGRGDEASDPARGRGDEGDPARGGGGRSGARVEDALAPGRGPRRSSRGHELQVEAARSRERLGRGPEVRGGGGGAGKGGGPETGPLDYTHPSPSVPTPKTASLRDISPRVVLGI